MKKFVVGPALTGLAVFVWGFLFWGAPHYLPYKANGTVPDDVAAMEALHKIFPATGYYLLPNPVKGSAAMAAGVKHGLAQVNIVTGPLAPFDPADMALGLVHCYVLALALTILMLRLAPAFRRPLSRVKFCAALGLLVALHNFAQAIWWKQPLGWVTIGSCYYFVEFVIAGLVLAKFVTPKDNAAPAA
jgi:hypothetical protein